MLTIAIFSLVLGYIIGFCRGWMRGVEETTRIWNAKSVSEHQPHPTRLTGGRR